MTIAEKLTLIAQNEQKVYNAGYEKGKSEGGGGGEKPTLFAPSIELNFVSSELTITDDKNGAFEVLYDLYAGGNKLATLSSKTATLTDYMEHTETIEIKVQATSAMFNSSEFSVVEWVKYDDDAETAGLAYAISVSRDSAYCNGIGTATETNIRIASVYEGVPVTSIGSSAFKNNSSLTSVVIPNSVTMIGSYSFEGCSNLTSVIIPNSVTMIYPYAFRNCSSLLSIEIPNSVTAIYDYAFGGCNSLTSVVIPNSVTTLSIDAFEYCKSLTSVFIGTGVTSISAYLFYGCSKLKRVDFSNHTSIPSLTDKNAFNSTHSTLQIKVPASLIDSWKSATNWANLASKIVTEFTNTL